METVDPETLALIFAVLTVGGVVKGVTGIGLPLVAVSAVASIIDVPTAVALISVPILGANLWQAAHTGSPARSLRRFWPVLVPLILGLWWSTGMLAVAAARTLNLVLGTTVVIFALLFYASPRLRVPHRAEQWAGVLVGVAAGVVGGFSTVFGPPISMYLLALDLKKDEFVQAVGTLFFAGSVPMFTFYWMHGVVGPHNLGWSALACLPVMLGLAAGQWVRGRVNQETFRKALLAVLFLVGINLLRRALLG